MNQNRILPREATQQQALTNALTGAVAHIQAGRLDEAIKVLQASGVALKNPVGRNILGDIRLRQGNPRDALKAFDSAIKLAPTFPEAHCNRGVALQELGRFEEALAAEERALRYRPDYANAHYNRGNILMRLDRRNEAIAAYDRALKQNPAHAEAYLNRGMTLDGEGRAVEALADFRRALGLKPDLLGAHIGQASAYRQLRQMREAFAAVNAALAIHPGNAEALILKAHLLTAVDKFEAALEAVDTVIAAEPDNATAHAERASVLRRMKRPEEALAAADEAVRLGPNQAEGYSARAMALSDLGRLEEQLETLKIARRHGASGVDYYHAQAIALAEFGDPAEAAACYERAIALEPEAAYLRHNYGLLSLYRGDFSRGWAEHEWRLKDIGYTNVDRAPLVPDWQGEDVAGKRLLVNREQGHGDTIQFVRFLPLLAAMNAKVTLTVPSSLKTLLQRAFPDVDMADVMGLRGDFDYQVALMSLPARLGVGRDQLARTVPYLIADDAMVAKWRDRLGPDGFKVGIAWQGSPEYFRDRYRSMPLTHFRPLAEVAGVRLISVQAVNGLDQLDKLPPGMKVESFGAEIGNNPNGFEEIAGLMANLDLVISSDTVSVHLAGALARPVWVALRHRPDWRWLDQGSTSPWYPTMRLFRQKRHLDWEGVFAEIAAALAEEVAARG